MPKRVHPLRDLRDILRTFCELLPRVCRLLQSNARSKRVEERSHLRVIVNRVRPHEKLHVAQMALRHFSCQVNRAVVLL